MPKPKTDRTPWDIPRFVKRSYPVGNRTLSPKLFLKTLVSLVNSPMLVVILPLKSIDPEAPLFSLVQNTSGKGEIIEVVFRNGWDYMKPVLVAEKTRSRVRAQRHHLFWHTRPLAKITRTGKMPIPQELFFLVGWASCPSHKFMKRTFARGLLYVVCLRPGL